MTSPLDGLATLRTARTKRISSYDRTGGNSDRIPIEPGETAVLADIEGSGIIKHIWFTIAHGDAMYRRNMILRMYWDGQEHPSVEAPVGDFFGQGFGEHYNYVSLPLAAAPVGGRGLNCYFPMPFSKGARIEIENDSDEQCRSFYYYVDYEEHDSIGDDQARFHAWWNRELTDPTENESQGGLLQKTDEGNYLFLEAEGRGHFVGLNYYVQSPTPIWYGEGDDMFLVDGEPWPGSAHGTGTEDYFNMSWCPKEPYQHPYFGFGRINENIGWLGRTHCYRFHLEDPVMFTKSLRASIEHGHSNALTLDMSTVAYWYQTLPSKPFPTILERAGRQPQRDIGPGDIHRWRQAWRNGRGAKTEWGNES
ncbi:MAG: DUF2961 domain-containing protein [Candidatus Poribacteria bacterium]|nr:DUF2961 domain-containing protein [Candidatus Poribacteria bacterium]